MNGYVQEKIAQVMARQEAEASGAAALLRAAQEEEDDVRQQDEIQRMELQLKASAEAAKQVRRLEKSEYGHMSGHGKNDTQAHTQT